LQVLKGDQDQKKATLIKQVEISGNNKVYLQIETNGDKCNFQYATQPDKWKLLLGDVDGKYLSTKVAGGFVGSLFALYATSSGEASQNVAGFKWLDYAGNDEIYR
jgi:alpha-N-arabinofuranosidase